MKISSRFSVATHILALLHLEKKTLCTSEWIANSVNTNPVVIRRILGQLKKAEIVQVRSGVGGSFLMKELAEITLLDVYHAVEVVDEGELFQVHEGTSDECLVGANICSVLSPIVCRAQSTMEQVLAEITMEEVVTDLENKLGGCTE